MPKLSEVIELTVFGSHGPSVLDVAHHLEGGKIVHTATVTYQFPAGAIDGPIEIDIDTDPGVTIVIVGAEVASK